MPRKILFLLPLLLLFSVLIVFPAQATDQPAIQSANYCPACHLPDDTRLDDVTAWSGGIAHNQVNPCPAAAQISEEIYYTERLMLAIERARDQAPASADLEKSDSRFAGASQQYSRLLDAPVSSLDAFSAEAKMVRYQMGKSYTAAKQAIETAKRARVLWVAVGVTLVMVGSLVWGWVNAQKALRIPHSTPKKKVGTIITWAVVLILVFVFFALPIFRLPSQETTTSTVEEQERQAVLDETGRAASTADRALSRASMLARIGAIWTGHDPAQGDAAMAEALAAAEEAYTHASALWGLSQEAREAGGMDAKNQADAALVAANLDSVRGRAWASCLVAEAWMDMDPEQAEAVLASALAQTETATYPYAQLDLRAIAVAYAKLDPQKGALVARRIGDPALRSWALREIATISGDASYFDAAAETARRVSDPVDQARVLRELGVASGDTNFFDQAAEALGQVEGAALAYALADLAAASGDASLAAQIATQYPSAQTLAYVGLGDYEKAWQVAAEISDPFEQARAQAAIAGAWGNPDAAAQISNPLLRDRALRDVSLKTGNPALVDDIQDSYYQVQALTAFERYEDAWQLAEDLREGYPLVALGTAWAVRDPEAAGGIIELLDREADKAEVLRAIAAASGEPEDFGRALDMALAARVRGDSLAPVQASIELANAFSGSPAEFDSAMSQAYEAALKINISY